MGLMGLLMAYYEGLQGILSGLTNSTDHPSRLKDLVHGPHFVTHLVLKFLVPRG